MATTTCGWCGAYTVMQEVSELVERSRSDLHAPHAVQAAFSCPGCKGVSVALTLLPPDARTFSLKPSGVDWDNAKWVPFHREHREYLDVPEPIASAASEVALCFSVGAYRAVGSLPRAVAEATAKEQGAGRGNLETKIDALEDLHRQTRRQAHAVRHFGNDMAHGDFADPVSKEEAAQILGLMDAILREVYQSPAELDRLEAARLAKKQQPASPEEPAPPPTGRASSGTPVRPTATSGTALRPTATSGAAVTNP